MSTQQPATPDPAPLNKDRVTPPVVFRAAILGILGVLAALGIDLNISESQAGALADTLLWLLPLLGTLAGSVWGAFRARDRVTPIGPDDTPRNAQGVELVPGGHVPQTGYPRPRVNRRGIDHDPDRY